MHLTEDLLSLATARPFLSISIVLFSILVATRIISGYHFWTATHSNNQHHALPILPYWIPYLGHTIPFSLRFQSFIAEAKIHYKLDNFAIILGGKKQDFVTTPSLAKNVYALRNEISAHDFALYFMQYFWKDYGGTARLGEEAIWKNLHPILFQLNRDPFVTNALAKTVEFVEQRVHGMVSFNNNPTDQHHWERTAKLAINPGPQITADADLYLLIRDFVGDLACRVLMGRDFIEGYPEVLQDIWAVDSGLMLFMAGAPDWLPNLRAAAAARERFVDAVNRHHEAIVNKLEGRDTDSRWSDDLLTDCSKVIVDRATMYHKLGADGRTSATGGATVLWAMMVNANQVIFWMLFHLYSNPSLLSKLREEIAPYVTIPPANSSSPPSQHSPEISINLKSLQSDCPLLSATFMETMRLNSLSQSTKTILQDFSVTESIEDAHMQGHINPHTYNFKKGDILWLPHAVHQKDTRFWPEPDNFDPNRFLTRTDDKDGKDGKMDVEYKTMKVWGGGASMCKGKAFAEGEVVAFVAAILMVWDCEKVGDGGQWIDPGRSMGGGTAQPQREVRVRWKRRA